MATTVSAIRTALESVVTALTPANLGSTKTTYTVASRSRENDDRPLLDKDREFTLGDIPAAKNPYFGDLSGSIVETTFELMIGHKKKVAGKITSGMARRDQDIEQIVRALERPATFPADVCVVELVGTEYQNEEQHWITTLRFALSYAGAV